MDVSPIQGGTVKIDQAFPDTYPAISTVTNGKSVTFEAIPADGFKFVNWSGSITGQDNFMTNPVTIEMTCSKNITANFIQKDGYYLNIAVNGSGTVTPSVGTDSYTQGEVVKITAVPNTDHQFNGWIGNVDQNSSANTTVIMDSSKTVIANFSLERHLLTLKVNGAGSVYPSEGTISYFTGNIASIIASPEIGYQFAGWTGDVKDPNSARTTVTIDSDKTVIANFSEPVATPVPAVTTPALSATVAPTPVATITPTPMPTVASSPAVTIAPSVTISPGVSETPVTSNPVTNKPINWVRGIGIAGIIVLAGIGVWLLSRKTQ